MELFCTAGRGTEVFVRQEVCDRFREYVKKVQTTDGKVFFQIQESCQDIQNRVTDMMIAERMFIHVITRKISDHSSRRSLLTLMHSELNKRSIWETAINSFHRLKNNQPSEKYHVQDRHLISSKSDNKFTGFEETATYLKKKMLNSDERSDEKTDSRVYLSTFVKRSYVEVTKDSDVYTVVKRPYEEVMKDSDVFSVLKRPFEEVIKDSDVSPVVKRPYEEVMKDSDVFSVVKRPYDEVIKDSDVSPVIKKHCTQKSNKGTLTFRVSCKFAGSIRHKLKTQMSAKQMGVLISKLMGWKTELRHPDIEICIHMNDDTMVVGIPVYRKPLSRREYIKHDGLRSTVCRIMAQLANIQPGDVILDPMCGKGVILLEALHLCQRATYLGMDISVDQLTLAQENIDYKPEHQNIQVVQGNCLDLPLHDNSINKIVTDAPFGQNYKTQTDLHQFYLQMLSEAFRVLKVNGIMVLLTSKEIKDRLYQTLHHKDSSNKDIESKCCHSNNTDKSKHTELFGCMNQDTDLNHKEKLSEPRSGFNEHGEHSNRYEGAFPFDCVNEKSDKRNSSDENIIQNSDDSSCIEANTITQGQHSRDMSYDIQNDNMCRTVCKAESVLSYSDIREHDELTAYKTNMAGTSCNTYKYDVLKNMFTIVSHNYIKLGKTDGYICVLLSKK